MYGGHSRNGHATFDPNTFVLSIICTVGTQEKIFAISEFISAHSTLSKNVVYIYGGHLRNDFCNV